MLLGAIAAAVLVVTVVKATGPVHAPVPTGTALFVGDFETGLAPPWTGVQECPDEGNSGVERVSTPVSGGAYAAKAWVRGKCRFGSQRAEVLGGGRYTEGQRLYFGHSVYYPAGFPATQSGWCVNMQIHTEERGSKGRPSAFSLNCTDDATSETMLRAGSNPAGSEGGCIWKTSLARRVWHHFVWRIKFSSTNGDWDLWYRPGTEAAYTKVLNHCKGNALLTPRDHGYLKLGIYSEPTRAGTVTVYHDDAKVGTSFKVVAP